MNRFANQKKGVALVSYRDGNPESPYSTVGYPSNPETASACAPPTPKLISKEKLFGKHAKRPATTSSPALRELFRLLDESEFYYAEVLKQLGATRKRSLNDWKSGVISPSFHTVEEIGQILGYRIEWVKNDPRT